MDFTSITVTNARAKLRDDVVRAKYCKPFEVGSSLIPKILMIMLPRVNWEIDSVEASVNATFLFNLSSLVGSEGISFPLTIVFQDMTICFLALPLEIE